MAESDTAIILHEATARRVVLARAVESADTQGKLLSLAEREQLEQLALQASRTTAGRHAPDPKRYLADRAQRILAVVGNRNPRLASLQHGDRWQGWVAWGLPALAFLVGAGLDRIDNPKQVNMLSPPLLAFLFWNVAIYAALLVEPWLSLSAKVRMPLAAMQRWLANQPPELRATGKLPAAVNLEFRSRWWQVAGALQGWRIRRALHASSAAWAVGVAFSIVLGGLVREYRVGWESTLLDLPQVHAFLSALFAPVVALLPVESFSAAELQRMHFRSGVDVGQAEARRWVGLYLALLLVVVVLPRSLLALYAAWRTKVLARAVRIDLRDSYFSQVMARVSPAHVLLAFVAPAGRAREAVAGILREASQPARGALPAAGVPWAAFETPQGDELRVLELPPAPTLPAGKSGEATAQANWREGVQRWLKGVAPSAKADELLLARAEADVVLLAVSSLDDLQTALPLLQWLGKPVLILPTPQESTAHDLRLAAQRAGVAVELLHEGALCWPLEAPLREAIAARVASHKAAGTSRLMGAWREGHQSRWRASMKVLAQSLSRAAGESQQVESRALSLARMVSAGEREAHQHARQQAMAAVLERVGKSQVHAFEELLRTHGIGEAALPALEQELENGFVVREAIDARQAGMAGAASGAAAGVSVDLFTGGITLGAAAALGALLGGTAAFAAAAWRNRSTPAGTTTVQLSDEMLQTLSEKAVLRYLAVVHYGRGTADARPEWNSEVVGAVAACQERLASLWELARQPGEGGDAVHAIAKELRSVSWRVLRQLHGDRIGDEPAGDGAGPTGGSL